MTKWLDLLMTICWVVVAAALLFLWGIDSGRAQFVCTHMRNDLRNGEAVAWCDTYAPRPR